MFRGEEASGILLMIAAAVAGLWAKIGDSYGRVWQTPMTVGIAPASLSKPLLLWINDGLTALFFFVVGLEIDRKRRLPFKRVENMDAQSQPVLENGTSCRSASAVRVIPAVTFVVGRAPDGFARSAAPPLRPTRP
jgi:Na+/H+ antiporter NhaA